MDITRPRLGGGAIAAAVRTNRAREVLCILLCLLCASAAAAAATPGEIIYRHGMLPSGAHLQGLRGADMRIEGADAACVNCHRRSGLGMKEGQNSIPPISGIYLFHPRAKDTDDLDLPFVETMRPDRDPYDDATLAHAIRDGIAADGHELSVLMPRYALDDDGMAALVSYLRSMTHLPVPGVTASLLHFATIITPDSDPIKRQGVLDVLQQFFKDKNDATRAQTPRLRSSHRMMFKDNRRWQLHVWELTGAPETWEQQLSALQAREPVFAVISGVGGATWAPIHRFCEQAAVPCLFPNVELPIVAEEDFYSLYFSRGVLLEADLVAHELAQAPAASAPGRVVQIFRSDDIGAGAAKELTAAAARAGRATVELQLKTDGSAELLRALKEVSTKDALVLWLRAKDLGALANARVPASTVFLSGLMGGLADAPLSQSWRSVARMAYPFDLPERRVVRVDYALGWFALRHIPVVSMQAQADTYLACGLLSETLNHMADSFIRDYLIERIEQTLDHRVLTGYYPRLSLAPGQRFASKGGYLMRFANPAGNRIIAASDWIVP
jgi:hypothetical protein